MAGIDKIVLKMRNQPNGVRMSEADRVLRHFGCAFARQDGSHCQYINADGDVITVQERKPSIKACYVKDVLARIEP